MNCAVALARAFGDMNVMNALYHDDVVWTLPPSLGALAGPYNGRAAVRAFNSFVYQVYDYRTVEIMIIDAMAEGDRSAARFLYSAHMLPTGKAYKGEYVLFVRAYDGAIIQVDERLDTLAVFNSRSEEERTRLFSA